MFQELHMILLPSLLLLLSGNELFLLIYLWDTGVKIHSQFKVCLIFFICSLKNLDSIRKFKV